MTDISNDPETIYRHAEALFYEQHVLPDLKWLRRPDRSLHPRPIIDLSSDLAFQLFKKNWEENKHSKSLHKYATLIASEDPSRARELFELDWTENQNLDSLACLSQMTKKGVGGPKDINKANELFDLAYQIYKSRGKLPPLKCTRIFLE